ncbi:DNA double-strand break repair and v(D)J recombination protein XRCC4 domain-containing protein [Sarocladium implicatum]|nr:DNA double-strand break repair and v(D)J recombination protein XRCC4 domain-containing protein [Sarocladium implicatum]
MASPDKVLKFPCSDGTFVLVQATSKGSNPLDLKLVGTEGGAAYRVTLKHDRIASLRAKNCQVSEAEWEDILKSIFQLKLLPDIQATAVVEQDTSISITVRKIIQGTTHRLGAVTLNYTEGEEIGLFEWCASAVDASFEGMKALSDAEEQKEALEAEVKDYKRQLEELIQAKNDDETTLLHKFRDLLNEKKLKIREQQKIISAASFPEGRPEPAGDEPSPEPVRKPAASRARKRKAAAKDAQDGGESPDAEEMEVDEPVKIEAEDTDPGNTTDGTASTEDDEDDEDGEDEKAEAPRASSSTRAAKPPVKEKDDKPPPPRSLPFNQKKAASKPAPKAQSETDSDDSDEL